MKAFTGIRHPHPNRIETFSTDPCLLFLEVRRGRILLVTKEQVVSSTTTADVVTFCPRKKDTDSSLGTALANSGCPAS